MLLTPECDKTGKEEDETDALSEEDDPPLAGHVSTRTFMIEPWSVPEGTEIVHIRISRQPEGGSEEFINNDPNVPVSSLPRPLEVTGTGVVIFRIYSVEDGGMLELLRDLIRIDFDEE